MNDLLGKIQDEILADRDCRSSPIFSLSLHRISRRRKDGFLRQSVSFCLLVFACLESDSRHDDRIITQQKPINARKKSIATFGAIAKKKTRKHSEQTGKG